MTTKTLFLKKYNFLSTYDPVARKNILLRCHTWLARALFILSVGIFHAVMTGFIYLEPIRYEFYTFLNLTPKSVSLLAGLWLSTTKWGARYRILTAVLLLPSFGFIVFIASYFGWLIGLISLATILWSYWIVIRRERL